MSVKVFDADVLVPEVKTIKAGGKIFSIGKIPMRISIKIYDFISKQKGANETEIMLSMVDTLTEIFKLADPTISRDWILDNVDMRQLAPLFTEICQMMSKVSDEKKPEAPAVITPTSI